MSSLSQAYLTSGQQAALYNLMPQTKGLTSRLTPRTTSGGTVWVSPGRYPAARQ
jgi:hypothetical protein